MPTLRILPSKLEAIETIELQKLGGVPNKVPAGRNVIHQTAVLVRLGVRPTTNGQDYLDASLVEFGHLFVET